MVATVDNPFCHYDGHDGMLHKHPFQDLVKRHVGNKYLIWVEKVYSIKPKFQEE